MPKQVDHEQRRRHIAEAVWVIAATRGLDAASLREVAAQAGVSMGMVQHYFGTKERMLLYACQRMVELADEGMQTLLAASPDRKSPRSIIRSVALQTLPLDAAQRAGVSVWYAFLARAAIDPDLAAFIREAWSGTHALVSGQLRAAMDAGDIDRHLDPDHATDALLALVDGLVSHLLVGHHSNERALAVVDEHLDRLFT